MRDIVSPVGPATELSQGSLKREMLRLNRVFDGFPTTELQDMHLLRRTYDFARVCSRLDVRTQLDNARVRIDVAPHACRVGATEACAMAGAARASYANQAQDSTAARCSTRLPDSARAELAPQPQVLGTGSAGTPRGLLQVWQPFLGGMDDEVQWYPLTTTCGRG